jgi:hypothetical protein
MPHDPRARRGLLGPLPVPGRDRLNDEREKGVDISYPLGYASRECQCQHWWGMPDFLALEFRWMEEGRPLNRGLGGREFS